MKITMAALSRAFLLLTTIAPCIVWLNINAMAVRFMTLNGRWPVFLKDDISSDVMLHDPIYRLLDPIADNKPLFQLSIGALLLSFPVWILLWFTAGRNLPPTTRYWLLGAFVMGWTLLKLDPTNAIAWFLD